MKHLAAPEGESTAPADVNVRSVELMVIAFAAGMAILYWAREVFIPIVLSILISYALEPIVVALTRIRIPRVLASGLVMLTLAGSLGYWRFVWGLWGTLLAVPMLVAVKACCDRIDDLKPIAELLGE